MKIDEHRLPQDGRFNFKISNEEVDLRISVLPTSQGEKIVMRLLRKSGGIPTLDELGLSGSSLRNLETAILRPHGINPLSAVRPDQVKPQLFTPIFGKT